MILNKIKRFSKVHQSGLRIPSSLYRIVHYFNHIVIINHRMHIQFYSSEGLKIYYYRFFNKITYLSSKTLGWLLNFKYQAYVVARTILQSHNYKNN